MYHDINRFFLCLALFWFGLTHNYDVAFAQEPLRSGNNGVQMQVGPNSNPADDDNANTMRVGPRNNRQREGNRNENNGNLYPNFANDVRVEVQIQPDMPFWHWGQTRPDNTRPPAYNDPRRPERPEFRPGDRPEVDRRPPAERSRRPEPQVQPVAPERRSR